MALVEEMGSLEDVPSVIGAPPAADAFARAMRTKQRHFLRLERESLLVIQQPPKVTSAPGSYRQAVLSDANVVGAWISEMANWTPARDQVENWISRRGIFIWFDGATPVSMCCLGRVLSRGVVLSHIYTRPDMRSRGYGGALTGAVSRLMLDDERRYVLLYCSISNAAAFRCYSKIGYRLYGQSAHYHFR
jgi:predicted GNAT family acetyltransferase